MLALAAGVLMTVTARADTGGAVDIGQQVPTFEATALSGEAFSLEAAIRSRQGGHRSVPFHRVPIRKVLRRASARVGRAGTARRGVLFVGVNPNSWETKDEVAEQAQRDGYAFAMVKDEHHAIANRLGARVTPEAFLVDSEGRLRYRGWIKSRQESPDLQHAIDAVLDGRHVRRPETKAFGCAVDRN